jgi:two-component system, NtrC family, sensor histidine kinase HydH
MNESLSVLSCAVHLALAVFTVLCRTRSSITVPFALICIDFFAWNFASVAFDLSNHIGWFFLERATSPYCAPIALHLILAFTGRLRRLRWVVIIAYASFAAISMPALLAFYVPWARDFTISSWWAVAHLSGVVVSVGYAGGVLVHQLRSNLAQLERTSTRLILTALVVGSVLDGTELAADLGVAAPRLGHIGTLLGTVFLGAAVLRLRLFELSWVARWHAVGIGVVAVALYLTVFTLMRGNIAMVVWGTTTVTLAVVLATRAAANNAADERRRIEHLATLGRFSAQMAHDLKNPLAALKGAVQYLMAAHQASQGSIEEREEFMQLLVEQIARMERIVDQYQRLGRVEPILRPMELNGIIQSVLALHSIPGTANVEVRANLDEPLPECNLDEDLIAGALDNLVRNAMEAMPSGGTLTVRTGLSGGGEDAMVVVAVEDTGVGMDVRVKERAFDDFFTTKTTGSGLGLAFVRRVAEAHGATVELVSALGRGTAVRMRLPVVWEF